MKDAFAWRSCSYTSAAWEPRKSWRLRLAGTLIRCRGTSRNLPAKGMRGLMSERSGPKGHWKITAAVRAKILLTVLREGTWELEAIRQRLAQTWHEAESVPSIQQVLEENGLGEPPSGSGDGGAVQRELFDFGNERQLRLNLGEDADAPAQGCRGLPAEEKENGMNPGRTLGGEVGDQTCGGPGFSVDMGG